MSAEHFDVVIVGGGMVGASLACALSNTTLRVAVIESTALLGAGHAPSRQPSFDARSTALSLSSARFLDGLGLWQAVRGHAQAIQRIHVSDRGHFGSTRMDAREEGLEALGFVVENQWLGSVLHGALARCPSLRVLAPASVANIRVTPGGARLDVREDGRELEFDASLAVIADGARSGLAARLGIAIEQLPYGQHALITNIGHQKDHGGLAFERFSDQGPLAMLPLPPDADRGARSALVWVLPPALATAAAALDESSFLRRLQTRFGYRLGRLSRCGERHIYPLGRSSASEQARAGVVLLGNAAHSLHPVAGQGFNLSLRDVAALAELLREADARGENPGSLALLQRFVDAQRLDQELTGGFSDVLPRLFGSAFLPLAAARGLGLIGLDLLPGARSLLVRQATGLGGS